MVVCCNTLVLSRVFRSTVDYLHSNHTIGVTHGILKLGQLLVALVPLDGRHRLARETAEKFASLVALDDTRTQEESEAWRALALLLPQLVGEWLATTHNLFLWPVLRDLWRESCWEGSECQVGRKECYDANGVTSVEWTCCYPLKMKAFYLHT